MSDLSRNAHQTGRPPTTLNLRRPVTGLQHRESLYRGGRFRHWVKIKNRAHPAFSRVQDQF